jgi:hypothetical protein
MQNREETEQSRLEALLIDHKLGSVHANLDALGNLIAEIEYDDDDVGKITSLPTDRDNMSFALEIFELIAAHDDSFDSSFIKLDTASKILNDVYKKNACIAAKQILVARKDIFEKTPDVARGTLKQYLSVPDNVKQETVSDFIREYAQVRINSLHNIGIKSKAFLEPTWKDILEGQWESFKNKSYTFAVIPLGSCLAAVNTLRSAVPNIIGSETVEAALIETLKSLVVATLLALPLILICARIWCGYAFTVLSPITHSIGYLGYWAIRKSGLIGDEALLGLDDSILLCTFFSLFNMETASLVLMGAIFAQIDDYAYKAIVNLEASGVIEEIEAVIAGENPHYQLVNI